MYLFAGMTKPQLTKICKNFLSVSLLCFHEVDDKYLETVLK